MKELVKIQKELKAPKGQYNSFGKYRYRSCEDILEAVKPLTTAAGCVITVSDELVLVGDRYYVKATARLTNSAGESVETTALAREAENQKGMDASQITGTASSYARKYALNGLFAIDDTKDADTDETTRLRQAEIPGKINDKWMKEQQAKEQAAAAGTEFPAWVPELTGSFEAQVAPQPQPQPKPAPANMPEMTDAMWQKTVRSEAEGKKTVDGERIKDWWIRMYKPGKKQIELFNNAVLAEIQKMVSETGTKPAGADAIFADMRAEEQQVEQAPQEDMPEGLGL